MTQVGVFIKTLSFGDHLIMSIENFASNTLQTPRPTLPKTSEGNDIFEKCRPIPLLRDSRRLHSYPFYRNVSALDEIRGVVDGRQVLIAGTNDYLGLARDPRVVKAAAAATAKFGAGCTGSRLLTGNIALHMKLEEALAEFLQRDAVLVFATGYQANLGALQGILSAKDLAFCDREVHASIIDGVKLSGARLVPYAHNSEVSLVQRMERETAKDPHAGRLIVADSVFSMSGNLVDLEMLVCVAKRVRARVLLDEAHALGVFGFDGSGLARQMGLGEQVDLVTGTFSKSFGSTGGFVAGSHEVIDWLRHEARAQLFTAGLTPGAAGAALEALSIIRNEPELREKLWARSRHLHSGLREFGFQVPDLHSPIIPVAVGSELKAFEWSAAMFDAGIAVVPGVYPAVRKGCAIMRVSVTAKHCAADIDQILKIFCETGRQVGLIPNDGFNTNSPICGA